MRTAKSGLMALTFVGASLISGCDESTPREDRAQQAAREQPVADVEYSVERNNINERLRLTNDPNQLMWVYCMSMNGNVALSSPVVGKLSSSTKRIEPNVTRTVYEGGFADHPNFRNIEEISADRTYGSSDNYVYWFTPEGQYFQWNVP